MAKIDDLLNHITDGKLRQQLINAVSEIRDQREFGLVFEPHIPEMVCLPRFRIRKGCLVTRRDRIWGDEWVVESLVGNEAQLRHPRTNEERTEEIDKLIVIKPFGEPIYPVLVPLEQVNRHKGRPWHSVISGENYHALHLLLYLYEGQADCIYIDPPYNTGNRDWTYNNRFVDSNDTYSHSKWLSFMDKRLRLAKRLLSPDGVLIVTIDEHEVLHLGMLLERVFSEYTRQMITIVNNPKGVTQGGFSRVSRNMLFFVLQAQRALKVAEMIC
jgi:adenine-specific DNA-methyltransferase